MKTIVQSFLMVLVLTVLTGVGYPLFVTGMAQVLSADGANGSLIEVNGKLRGSRLIAQKCTDPRYFWPRPSAADYATVASGASNKGPTSSDLKKSVDERRAALGTNAPVDMLTASGSGLDPHVTPAAAHFQVARVAAARGMDAQRVLELVDSRIEPPQWRVFGEARVNVLTLNVALDQLH